MSDLVERLRDTGLHSAAQAADALEAQAARIAALEGELEAAREAATDLYKAGRWEITDRFVSADDQAVMWERLRDAIGLPKGTHTALASEEPRP
jgi:hypothetical protein